MTLQSEATCTCTLHGAHTCTLHAATNVCPYSRTGQCSTRAPLQGGVVGLRAHLELVDRLDDELIQRARARMLAPVGKHQR